MLTDTHCHLNLNLYQADLHTTLQKAWDQGVERILIPGIDLETSRLALEIAETHPACYAAIGVHPNDALSWQDSTLAELRALASHPRVVAIGEIGLDYYRDHAPHPLQQEILRHQLALAAELNLPVVLHNRQAFEDLWQIVQPWQMELAATQSQLAQRPGVFHSFDGSLEIGQMLIQHHFRLGISGPVTFRNARERQQLIAKLPLEALLTETDSPYLTPDPFRGRTNEPAYIVYIAQKIADLHSQSIERVATITSHNAEQLFLWGSPN